METRRQGLGGVVAVEPRKGVPNLVAQATADIKAMFATMFPYNRLRIARFWAEVFLVVESTGGADGRRW